MSHPSRAVLAASLAALSDQPRSVAEICKSLDCWARITVKIALDQLVVDGKANRESIPVPGNGFKHLYRLPD